MGANVANLLRQEHYLGVLAVLRGWFFLDSRDYPVS
jgi:hypothetical protein